MMIAIIAVLLTISMRMIREKYRDTFIIKWLKRNRGPLTIVTTLVVIFSQSRDLRYTALMMPGVVILLIGIVLTIHDHRQKQRAALN